MVDSFCGVDDGVDDGSNDDDDGEYVKCCLVTRIRLV